MQNVLIWFVKKRSRLAEYLDETKPSCVPNAAFWIMVHVMRGFVEKVNFWSVKFQGLYTLVNEQQARMKTLVNELIEDGNIEGSDDFIDDNTYRTCGSFRMSYDNACSLIRDQGIFVADLLRYLVADLLRYLQQEDPDRNFDTKEQD